MATAKTRGKPAPKISKRKAAPAKVRRAPASKAKAKPQAKPTSPGIVRGVHALLYSSQADELRAFIRDKLGFKATDVGGGWLVFDVPEADLGVHPTDSDPASGTAHVSFYCDDIAASLHTLKSRGVEVAQEVVDQGWGLVAKLKVPGGFEAQLYQPTYKK
jgi:predicted enzyme related to lactoylglutathione lyase